MFETTNKSWNDEKKRFKVVKPKSKQFQKKKKGPQYGVGGGRIKVFSSLSL
jgi:hypothetical protein